MIIAAVGKLGGIKGTHPKTSKDTNKRKKRKSPAPEIPSIWFVGKVDTTGKDFQSLQSWAARMLGGTTARTTQRPTKFIRLSVARGCPPCFVLVATCLRAAGEDRATAILNIEPTGGGFARQKAVGLLVETIGPWIGLERRYMTGYGDILDSSRPYDMTVDAADSVCMALKGPVFVWWFRGEGAENAGLPAKGDDGWNCIRRLPGSGATIPAGTPHVIVTTVGAICVLAADAATRQGGMSLPESARRSAIWRAVLCARDTRMPQSIRQEAEQEYRKLVTFYGKAKGAAKLEWAREKARQAWAARGTVS